ncbi:dapper 1-like isoform X2 [Scyliorhinus torazame]|uniref:dapper 1-like isoform X2 n=1 Tax=Scyliorhinus torazame TaxID=75743 RepID=UPI003B5C78A7
MLPAFSLPASLDRSRHRERLEASLAGLLELQLLRHRQQYLVQEALQIAGAADPPSPLHWDLTGGELNGGYPVPGDTGASSLRRHLNGLRRQELAFVTPLQQLERQVNDLRLEATQTSGGEPETDSRPSSAEPLHLDREESLSYADSDYVSSVPRSFSVTRSDSLEALMDIQPKYQCDLITRDGLDLFPYPSPLHAMAVQSPLLRQALRANSEEKPMSPNSYLRGYKMGVDGEIFFGSQGDLPQGLEVGQSKRLENYIAGLVHKRVYPIRSNKPRTSLSMEPIKGLMRQNSMCQRSMEAPSPPSVNCEPSHPSSERRNISSSHSFEGSLPSPKYRPQWSASRDQLSVKKNLPACQTAESFLAALQQQKSIEEAQCSQQSLRKPVRLMANTPPMRPTSLEYHELNYHPAMRNSPQESYYQNVYELDDRPQAFLSARSESVEAHPPPFDQRLGSEVRDKSSPPHSTEDTGYQMVNAQYIPAQQPYKAHTANQSGKAKGVLLSKGRSVDMSPEGGPPGFREKGKASNKKCRFSEEAELAKRSGRKPSPRHKKTCRSQSENSLLNRPGVTCIKYNTVERDEAMAARPLRAKRHASGSYRRWKSTAEISREEATATSDPYPPAEGQRRVKRYQKAPGAPGHPGSDSEYPAQCHEPGAVPPGEEGGSAGAVYAANCFGDSESSLSEVESPGFSTCSSDTDEEGGGLVWPQQVAPQTAGRDAGQPKVFVKIKASHALKKKILRFRTGSLKVMTTV